MKKSVFKAVMTAAALAAASMTATALIATPRRRRCRRLQGLVDAAKAQGVVGEQSNGFLGFVASSADPAPQGRGR
ncbi:MAG: DUF1318 domain-containing protein [Asticcacaulis sp.]